MRQHTGATRSARFAVRISQEDRDEIEKTVRLRSYTSPSAFIRAAIRNELKGRPELSETEERIAGGFDRMSRENLRVVRGQQALFALFDTFVKAILTCVPEPPPESKPQAIAIAKDRYHQLIKAAGLAMSGDALAAMKDLLGHGKN